MLREDQAELLAQATALRDRLTRRADSIDEAMTAAEDGLARVRWGDVGTEGEQRLLTSGIFVRRLLRDDSSIKFIVTGGGAARRRGRRPRPGPASPSPDLLDELTAR